MIVDASQPVDIPSILKRLEEPPLQTVLNRGDGSTELLSVALMISAAERDVLVAALRRAYPNTLRKTG